MILVVEKQSNQITVQKQVVLRVRILEFNIPSGINNSVFTQKGELLVGTGDGAYIVFPPGADGSFLKYDSSQPGGVVAALPTVEVEDGTNYLINPAFYHALGMTDPTTLTTIPFGGYGPDQWKMYADGDFQYRKIDGSGVSGLNSPWYGEFKKVTNSGKFLIAQPLPNVNTLRFRNKPITFQFKLNSNTTPTVFAAILELQSAGVADVIPDIVSAWNAEGATPTFGSNIAVIGTPVSCSVNGSIQTFKFSGQFPANSKNLIVAIWSNLSMVVGDIIRVAETDLHYGEDQRGWEPVNVEEMEYRVLSYFERTPSVASGIIGAGQCFSTTQALIYMPFSRKIKSPQISANSIGSLQLTNAGGGGVAVSTISVSRTTLDGALLLCTVASGLVAGNGTILFDNSGGSIDISARL